MLSRLREWRDRKQLLCEGRDPNRVRGDRPYSDTPPDELERILSEARGRMEEAEHGYEIQPTLDRKRLIDAELERRNR